MIPNLKAHTTYAVHLRSTVSSGGKDWIGSVTTQGEIHTYWGKTGNINQHAGKAGDIGQLNKIISEKMNGKDRYCLVDEYDSQQGWQSQRNHVQQSAPPQPVSPPLTITDWNHDAPATSIQWDF